MRGSNPLEDRASEAFRPLVQMSPNAASETAIQYTRAVYIKVAQGANAVMASQGSDKDPPKGPAAQPFHLQ